MKLIADSGSTKTSWIVIKDNQIINRFSSIGLNPYFVNSEEISAHVSISLPSDINPDDINDIYFYGAGCALEERTTIVVYGLYAIFKNATFYIYTDLLAAARALFGNKQGIVAILGTGSNSGFYNGDIIKVNIPGYGYLLGDEGSGATLGMKFIKAYLHKEIPESIAKEFNSQFNLTNSDILENVYRKPMPNRFFASFGKFIHANINDAYIYNMVKESFDIFFDKYICTYHDYKSYPIKFSGSIAYHYKDILILSAKERNLTIDEIIEYPADRLAEYYL